MIMIGKNGKCNFRIMPPEPLHEEEIKIFFDAIKGKKKYPFSLEDELKILQVLDAIESSKKKKGKPSLILLKKTRKILISTILELVNIIVQNDYQNQYLVKLWR